MSVLHKVWFVKKNSLIFIFLFYGSFLSAQIPYEYSQSLASAFYSKYQTFRLHSRSLFNRIGELRENLPNNGLWINNEWGLDGNRELDYAIKSQGLYNNLSFGMDTFFILPDAQLYFGGGFDFIVQTAKADLFGLKGENYGLGVYVTYYRDTQFFVDVSAQYFYTSRNIVFKNSALENLVYGGDESNFYLGINIGQRFGTFFSLFPHFFFLEPSLMLETGYLPTQKIHLRNVPYSQMKGFIPFGIKGSLAFGREWNGQYNGALKGGISLEYDQKINGKITIKDTPNPDLSLRERDDFRIGMFLEADFILNHNLRFFFRSNHTFLGKLNTLYAMTLGMRFGFGVLDQHRLHKKETIDWKNEKWQ